MTTRCCRLCSSNHRCPPFLHSCRHDGRLASAPTSIPQTPHTTPNRTPADSLAGSPTRRSAGTPLPSPATPAPLAMPPLRSIASRGEEPEPAGSSFEQLAAAISSPSTLQAAQVRSGSGGGSLLLKTCSRGCATAKCASAPTGLAMSTRRQALPCPHIAAPPHPVQALLARLEARVSAKGVAAGSCAPLLRRLFPRAPPGSQPRYPARIFLCAYMVLAHPGEEWPGRHGCLRCWAAGCNAAPKHSLACGVEGCSDAGARSLAGGNTTSGPPPACLAEVVFNSQGEREAALASAARSMLSAFEPLLARLAEPAVPPAGGAAAPADADAGRAGDGAEAEDEAAPMPAPLADMLQVSGASC